MSEAVLPGGIVPVNAATSPATPLILYYHNETSNPMIAGFTRSMTILNTTTNWSLGPQLWPPSPGSFTFLFYLAPNLASSLTLNGTILLHPWVSGNTTGGSTPSAGFGLTIYDVASSGFIYSASASGPGNLDVASNPTDVNKLPANSGKQLVYNVPSHLFAAGDSIAIGVAASPSGTTSVKFYYDALSTPSYVELFSAEHPSVNSVWYTNEFGGVVSSFVARNVGVLTVNSLISDPLGMYDLMLPPTYARDPNIRLDIVTPSATVLFNNVSMTAIQGTLSGANGTLTFTLNVPDTSGVYNLTIRLLDNSGNNFAQASQLPILQGFPLTVKVVDSGGNPISGVWVEVFTSNGVPYDFRTTNSSGEVTFTVPSAAFKIQASYTATYLMTSISNGNSTSIPTVTAPTIVPLKLSSYPPAFTSTVLYTLIFWGVIVLIVLAIAVIVTLARHQLSSDLRSLSGTLKRTSPAQAKPSDTGSNFCIYCGSPLKAGATACQNCGKTQPKVSA